MSTQKVQPENVINNPFNFATKNAKEKEVLKLLAALLPALEHELEGATKAGKAKGTSKAVPEQAEGESFTDVMGSLAAALQMLQVVIAKNGYKTGELNAGNSEVQVQLAQTALNQIKKKVGDLAKSQEHQKHTSFWMKIVSIFTTAVVDVIAIALLQPEVAVIATAACVMSTSGLLGDVANHVVAPVFKPLLGEKGAEIVGAILVTGLVLLATAALAPEDDPEVIANAGENIAEDAASGAAAVSTESEEAAESVQETQSAFSRVKSMLNKIKIFNRFSTKTNMMLMIGTEAAQQDGLIKDAMNGAAIGIADAAGASEKEKQRIEEAFNIVGEIIAMIVMVGSGAAMTAGLSSNVTTEYDATTRMGRLLNGIKTAFESPEMMNAARKAQLAGYLGENIGGGASSAYQIQQGKIQEALGALNAELSLDRNSTEMSSSAMLQQGKSTAAMAKSQGTGNQSIAGLAAGEAAIARVLINNRI